MKDWQLGRRQLVNVLLAGRTPGRTERMKKALFGFNRVPPRERAESWEVHGQGHHRQSRIIRVVVRLCYLRYANGRMEGGKHRLCHADQCRPQLLLSISEQNKMSRLWLSFRIIQFQNQRGVTNTRYLSFPARTAWLRKEARSGTKMSFMLRVGHTAMIGAEVWNHRSKSSLRGDHRAMATRSPKLD